MKRILASLLAFCVFTSLHAQTGVPGQISTSFVQVRDYGSGTPVTRPCMLWLPSNYSLTHQYMPVPLIVFFHGHGERGNPNGSNVNALRAYGPLYHIYNNNWDGYAAYGGSCGPNKFAVFAFQSDEDFSHAEIDYALTQLRLRYNFDPISVTGPSGGGGTTHSYAMDQAVANKPTHMIPMSVPAANFSNINTMAQNGMNVWAFADDIPNVGAFYTTTTSIVSAFNNAVPNSAKFTGRNLGHCCWNDYYSPSYREVDNDGSNQTVNIYEWLIKRLGYQNPGPPIYQCDIWGGNPIVFAGFITTLQTDKIGSCNSNATFPVYTNDGTISQGKTVWANKIDVFDGQNLHYGFSTLKLKGAPADKHLIINSQGEVTLYENCMAPAGYVSTGIYGNPSAACSASCSTQVYSNAGVVAQGIKLYQSDGVTPFNGGWADYGFTTTQYGTAQKRLNIDGSGNILTHENCAGGGARRPHDDMPEAIAVTSLQVFPNPASDQLKIRVPGPGERVQIKLYNTNGVVIYQSRISAQQHTIQTGNFPKGLYLLQLFSATGKPLESKKIMLH